MELIQSSGIARLFLLENGLENVFLEETPLHSSRDPNREASRFAEKIQQILLQNPNDQVLVVGIGRGYLLETPLALSLKERILFYEPYPDLYELLKHRGLIQSWKKSGLSLAGPGDLLRVLRDKPSVQYQVLVWPAHARREDLPPPPRPDPHGGGSGG